MLPLTIIFVVLAVMYYRTHVDILLLEGSHTLHFPRGIVVDVKDIVDVTYHTSHRRRGLLQGRLTVQTKDRTIRLSFVADCVTVGKTITELVYNRKRELEELPFA